MAMICGTPAPHFNFCPKTFSAAGLWCGRTLLTALTVLLAVLRFIFAAFTIVLLVSLLTVTAEGQGVTATLPEAMTEDSVIDFVTEQEISTVEAFIQALPPLHKRHFVAVHDSASPAADFISTSHPRIISWGADASFVVTWTTNPGDPDSDNVEFLQPVPAEGRWIAGVIDFSGDSPQLRHPAACAQCHGDLRKPLWGADDVHDGTEGETLSRTLSEDALALHQTMAASTHPRLTPLELNRYQNAPRTIGFANRESQIPTWEFALVLALRHSEVLFNRLRVRQDYDQLPGSVACSSFISDLERKIRSEFDQADYNIRLLSDTLEPVQGENSLTAIQAGEYKGGDVTLSLAIGFLIFHDLWQRFESVRALYRGTSNEHALGTLGFAPGFREMFLRYPLGQATVEDELVAAYQEFFELRGQASIDERALRTINPRYGSDFLDAHVAHFHDRVCSALSPPAAEAPATYSGNGNVTLLGQLNPRAPFTSYSDNSSTGQSYLGIWGYASAGREYALLTHSQGLSITEVTDPANPVEIQFIPSAGGRIQRDIDTYLDPVSGKTYAYFGGQEGANLYSIDLSYLPGTIPASGIVDLGRTNWTHTLQVADGLLFVNSAGSSLGCQIFDAQANPANPPLLAQSWSGSDRDCHDSFTRDNILYSADGYSTRWRIVDIAGIRGGSAPTLLGETAMKSGVYAHSSWLSDDSQYMYSFEEFNIEDINVFDVSDPANPVNVETFQWSGDATGNSLVHNGQVKGDLLHVAYYEAGFRVFDISDPANPVEVGMYETWRDPDGDGTFNKSITGNENGAWNVYTDLPSGYVLVSDTRSGLFVFQVISPPPPPPPPPPDPPPPPPPPMQAAPEAPTNLTAVGGDGQVVLSWEAPESDGGAEITDYEYRINGRNPWISIGSIETTYTVTGLVNGTEYTFQVRAVNRVGKSRLPNQTEATPEAPELLTLDFAHFVNGTSITSDLLFVNAGSVPVRPAIYFYDTEGNPIAAESVIDITGDLVVQEDGGLTVLTEMEPLGELTISTHGRGEVVSGIGEGGLRRSHRRRPAL